MSDGSKKVIKNILLAWVTLFFVTLLFHMCSGMPIEEFIPENKRWLIVSFLVFTIVPIFSERKTILSDFNAYFSKRNQRRQNKEKKR